MREGTVQQRVLPCINFNILFFVNSIYLMNLPNYIYMCVLCFFDEAEKGEISSGIIVAIVVSIFVAVMIFIATICYFCKRTKKKYDFECKNRYSIQDLFLC